MIVQTNPDRNMIYSVWSNPVPFRQARNAMSTNPSHSFFHHGVPQQSTGHRLFDHDVKATVFGQNHVSGRVLHREIANDHRRHRLMRVDTQGRKGGSDSTLGLCGCLILLFLGSLLLSVMILGLG